MENIRSEGQGAGHEDPDVAAQEAELASGDAEIQRPSATVEKDTPKELTDADTSGTEAEEGQGSAPAPSLPTTSCSEYHSARIASMLASRSEFESELEYRTAHSQVHWTELSHGEGASSKGESGSGSGESGDQFVVDHRQSFEELRKDAMWGGFCSAVADVVLGKKLEEGAQAVIYEALNVTFAIELPEIDLDLGKKYGYVVKVMKSGCALEDIQRQLPRELATLGSRLKGSFFFLYGALVKDHVTGRHQFGFVMDKRWGDLRRLIDLRMERNNAKGPPFSKEQVRWIVLLIAFNMAHSHDEMGIMHRDLKASNVLLNPCVGMENCDLVSSNEGLIFPYVSDWECSEHVLGTGFWRALELLQQLKNRTSSSEIVFTEEMDVYSFAMTCYKVCTGKLPFEGLPFAETRDAILHGARPELPQDMDPAMKFIISSCWNPDPSQRFSFIELQKTLAIYIKSKEEGRGGHGNQPLNGPWALSTRLVFRLITHQMKSFM